MTTSPETSQRPSAATAQAEIPTGSHASEAQRDQKETTTANAPSDPRTGALAGAGHSGLFRLSCRADQCPGTQRFCYHIRRRWLRTLRRRRDRGWNGTTVRLEDESSYKSERLRLLYRQFSERDPTQQLIYVASRSAPERLHVNFKAA